MFIQNLKYYLKNLKETVIPRNRKNNLIIKNKIFLDFISYNNTSIPKSNLAEFMTHVKYLIESGVNLLDLIHLELFF